MSWGHGKAGLGGEAQGARCCRVLQGDAGVEALVGYGGLRQRGWWCRRGKPLDGGPVGGRDGGSLYCMRKGNIPIDKVQGACCRCRLAMRAGVLGSSKCIRRFMRRVHGHP